MHNVFIDCVQTIFPVDGKATPVAPGTVIQYEVPDMYGRPWAHNLGAELGKEYGETEG